MYERRPSTGERLISGQAALSFAPLPTSCTNPLPLGGGLSEFGVSSDWRIRQETLQPARLAGHPHKWVIALTEWDDGETSMEHPYQTKNALDIWHNFLVGRNRYLPDIGVNQPPGFPLLRTVTHLIPVHSTLPIITTQQSNYFTVTQETPIKNTCHNT